MADATCRGGRPVRHGAARRCAGRGGRPAPHGLPAPPCRHRRHIASRRHLAGTGATWAPGATSPPFTDSERF